MASMDFHGLSWASVDFYWSRIGLPWASKHLPRVLTDFLGSLVTSHGSTVGFHGLP